MCLIIGAVLDSVRLTTYVWYRYCYRQMLISPLRSLGSETHVFQGFKYSIYIQIICKSDYFTKENWYHQCAGLNPIKDDSRLELESQRKCQTLAKFSRTSWSGWEDRCFSRSKTQTCHSVHSQESCCGLPCIVSTDQIHLRQPMWPRDTSFFWGQTFTQHHSAKLPHLEHFLISSRESQFR